MNHLETTVFSAEHIANVIRQTEFEDMAYDISALDDIVCGNDEMIGYEIVLRHFDPIIFGQLRARKQYRSETQQLITAAYASLEKDHNDKMTEVAERAGRALVEHGQGTFGYRRESSLHHVTRVAIVPPRNDRLVVQHFSSLKAFSGDEPAPVLKAGELLCDVTSLRRDVRGVIVPILTDEQS